MALLLAFFIRLSSVAPDFRRPNAYTNSNDLSSAGPSASRSHPGPAAHVRSVVRLKWCYRNSRDRPLEFVVWPATRNWRCIPAATSRDRPLEFVVGPATLTGYGLSEWRAAG